MARSGNRILRAGTMDRRIRIVEVTTAPDPEFGDNVPTETEIATVWAEKIEMRGRELAYARQVNAEATTKWRIRYLPGVSPTSVIFDVTRSGNVTRHDIAHISEMGRKDGLEIVTVQRAGVIVG